MPAGGRRPGAGHRMDPVNQVGPQAPGDRRRAAGPAPTPPGGRRPCFPVELAAADDIEGSGQEVRDEDELPPGPEKPHNG